MSTRRRALGSVLALAAGLAAAGTGTQIRAQGLPLLRPTRLKPGDTVGLFNPSGAIYERQPYARHRTCGRATATWPARRASAPTT
jgi:hypothetical protein